ncbi:hypothetical protein HN51_054763 [Arachis hypogaea]
MVVTLLIKYLVGKLAQIFLSASSGFSGLKLDKQDQVMCSNSSIIMNFSHFARPTAIVKANLQNIGLSSSTLGRLLPFFLLDVTTSSRCIISDSIFLHVSVAPAIPLMQFIFEFMNSMMLLLFVFS